MTQPIEHSSTLEATIPAGASPSDESAPGQDGATEGARTEAEGERADGAGSEAPTAFAELREATDGPADGPEGADGSEAAGDDSRPEEAGAGDALSDVELASAVAALVYASPEPISERRLQALLERPQLERIRTALATLRERLASSGLPYELRALAGGYQILTTADVGEIVQRLAKVRKTERISGAALETLAVVAYRQPVTKAEVEAIRGVQAGPILRTLIERGLVRVSGRSDDPGHPLHYGTTKEFLDRFGLGSLADLPRDGELARD